MPDPERADDVRWHSVLGILRNLMKEIGHDPDDLIMPVDLPMYAEEIDALYRPELNRLRA